MATIKKIIDAGYELTYQSEVKQDYKWVTDLKFLLDNPPKTLSVDTEYTGGEYYTPRPLIRAIVDVLAPRIGETICDPACGSAGFLCEAYDYLQNPSKRSKGSSLTTKDHQTLQERTFYGKEKKSLAYVIAIMNMILHGIEAPNVIHANTLADNISANVVGLILGTLFRFVAYRTWVFPAVPDDAARSRSRGGCSRWGTRCRRVRSSSPTPAPGATSTSSPPRPSSPPTTKKRRL